MKRREFISLIGGAAAAWPLPAWVQEPAAKLRRIGVLMLLAADDPESKPRIAAFQQGLMQWGWTDGHNVQIEIRWEAFDAQHSRKYAAELVTLAPDVILTTLGRLGIGSLDRPQHLTLAANEHDAPPAFHPAGELGRGVFGFGAAGWHGGMKFRCGELRSRIR